MFSEDQQPQRAVDPGSLPHAVAPAIACGGATAVRAGRRDHVHPVELGPDRVHRDRERARPPRSSCRPRRRCRPPRCRPARRPRAASPAAGRRRAARPPRPGACRRGRRRRASMSSPRSTDTVPPGRRGGRRPRARRPRASRIDAQQVEAERAAIHEPRPGREQRAGRAAASARRPSTTRTPIASSPRRTLPTPITTRSSGGAGHGSSARSSSSGPPSRDATTWWRVGNFQPLTMLEIRPLCSMWSTRMQL